jgi:hypothetical protein
VSTKKVLLVDSIANLASFLGLSVDDMTYVVSKKIIESMTMKSGEIRVKTANALSNILKVVSSVSIAAESKKLSVESFVELAKTNNLRIISIGEEQYVLNEDLENWNPLSFITLPELSTLMGMSIGDLIYLGEENIIKFTVVNDVNVVLREDIPNAETLYSDDDNGLLMTAKYILMCAGIDCEDEGAVLDGINTLTTNNIRVIKWDAEFFTLRSKFDDALGVF